MKTPEQLKGTIRSIAEKKNLRAQEVLQMFLFEQFSLWMWETVYLLNYSKSNRFEKRMNIIISGYICTPGMGRLTVR